MALVSGALSGLLLVPVVLEWGPLMAVDRAVADASHASAVRNPSLTRVNRVLSDWVWDPWTMRALVACSAVWLWWRGLRRAVLWLAVVTALGACVQQSMKVLVGRDRPFWPDPVDSADYAAFPSGHAMTATVTCALLLWLVAGRHRGAPDLGPVQVTRAWSRRILAVLALVSVLGVGLTRVYLGVHWASDVLAGWLLGACLAAVALLAYPRVAGPGSRSCRPGRAIPRVARSG
ncbi:phosphatase PAP2 family protein [Streptomyces sp. NPDC047928]|uniref:phosphatase PAP2 family protein n=1 Tax=unclassified Streptomyces TaxID=2593676 RepID=UPI00371100DC